MDMNEVIPVTTDRQTGTAEEQITATEQRSDHEAMVELQKLLNELGTAGGYSAGKPDGVYGNKTKRAIQVFQKQQGIPVDGVATYAILDRAKTAASGSPHVTTTPMLRNDSSMSPEGMTYLALSQCVPSSCLQGNQFVDGLSKEMTKNLPIDVQPYIAGFCLPEDTSSLERIYLYLVAQGAVHARLTLVKYDILVDYYSKAGVDLGIRKDAFKRSIESLDSDLRALAEDRQDGAEKLLKHFKSKQALNLLKVLPTGYEELEEKYREGATELMSGALAHSISSTFYLTRSTLVARKLLVMIKPDGIGSGGLLENLQVLIDKLTGSAKVAYFVYDTKGELTEMLLASTYAVRTFTVNIKEVPRIDQSEAEAELARLRELNGVTLDEFELAFEGQQQEQLNRMDV